MLTPPTISLQTTNPFSTSLVAYGIYALLQSLKLSMKKLRERVQNVINRENFSTVSLISKSFKERSSELCLEKHYTICFMGSQSAQFGCQVYNHNFCVKSVITINFFLAFFAQNTLQLSPYFIF